MPNIRESSGETAVRRNGRIKAMHCNHRSDFSHCLRFNPIILMYLS
jgi:hypothetical protein